MSDEPGGGRGGAREGAGGKSLYDPAYVKIVRNLARGGMVLSEIADIIEVHPRTLLRWGAEHPEFAEALKIDEDQCCDRTERTLYEMANGFHYEEEQAVKVRNGKDKDRVEIVRVQRFAQPNYNAAMAFLTNRRGDRWTNHRQIVMSGAVTHDHRFNRTQAEAELAAFYGAEMDRQTVDGGTLEALPAPSEETKPAE